MSREKGVKRFTWVFLIGFALFFLTFHLWSLLRYPAPFVDEAWLAARAWGFIETGRPFGALDQGVFDLIDGHWSFYSYIPTFIQALGLRWFDSPSLLVLRFVSFLSGIILLVAIFFIGTSLRNRRLGILATLLVGFSLPFVNSAHLGRADILTAMFGYWSIALYQLFREKSVFAIYFAGLSAGLAFEIHAFGAIFIPIVPILFFLDHEWRTLKHKGFWTYMIGAGSGFAFYFFGHVFFYPEEFAEFTRVAFSPTHLPPLLTLDIGTILESFRDTVNVLTQQYFLAIILIPITLFFLLKRNTRKDHKIIAIFATLFLLYAGLIRNKQLYYSILLSPALDLSLAAFVLMIFQIETRSRLIRIFGQIVVPGILILSTILLNWIAVRENLTKQYFIAQEKISSVVDPGQVILGSQTYWFDFYTHPYYSWENLIYFERYHYHNKRAIDGLKEFRPEILIIDNHWNTYITDEPSDDNYNQNLIIPKSDLEQFLLLKGNLLLTIEDGYYAPIRVFEINWDK